MLHQTQHTQEEGELQLPHHPPPFSFSPPPSSHSSSLVRLAGVVSWVFYFFFVLCKWLPSGNWWLSLRFIWHTPHGWSQQATIYAAQNLRCTNDDACRFTRGSHARITLAARTTSSSSRHLPLFLGLASVAFVLPFTPWTSSNHTTRHLRCQPLWSSFDQCFHGPLRGLY